ncbi:MAG: hypothetical protein HDR39_03580 [Treponema sp.]|nr:hypothetical protein [Treponema sp.]
MRMTARMFGVLCAASLVFCAACDGIGNKDEDGDKDKDNPVVTVSYDVGMIVTFMERQYLVTKNCEGAVTTELTAVQATDLGTYYPNERADAYRKKLLADYGVTAYVELFDITEDKDVSPSSGDSVLNDTYMILHDGQGVYRVKQRRIASDLFSGDDAENRSKPFNEKTNDELRRNYDPNLISITNFPFITDLSKRFQEEYSFIYADDKDADKQTLTYSDNELDYVFKRLNYTKINGSERNVYGFRDRKAVEGKRSEPQHCWELNHLNANKRFFEFDVISDGSSYRLVAQGEGTIDGNASDAVYKGTLTINSVQYDSSGTLDLQYNVGVKKNGNTVSKKVLPEGFDDNFVIKSLRTISLEGVNFDVHETITFFVPFFDDNFGVNHNAVLNKYTKVTFIPKAINGGVIYVPKTDTAYTYEFIAQFMKDYQTVFGNGGSQAGQGGSGGETTEPGAGKADWTGFTMVDSADELDFKAGTYEMKCASFEEYQGKTKFDTMIYDVEIIANTAVLREKSRIRVYSNQEDYDVKKASVKDIDGYSWEDSTRTITRTYSDVSDESMPLSEFKEEFFSFPEDAVEDDYSRTHTDKKLGRKNGVIQASCTETIRKTEVERIEKYYYTITLTPQK